MIFIKTLNISASFLTDASYILTRNSIRWDFSSLFFYNKCCNHSGWIIVFLYLIKRNRSIWVKVESCHRLRRFNFYQAFLVIINAKKGCLKSVSIL